MYFVLKIFNNMTFKKETLVLNNVKRFEDLSWFPNAHFISYI